MNEFHLIDLQRIGPNMSRRKIEDREERKRDVARRKVILNGRLENQLVEKINFGDIRRFHV